MIALAALLAAVAWQASMPRGTPRAEAAGSDQPIPVLADRIDDRLRSTSARSPAARSTGEQRGLGRHVLLVWRTGPIPNVLATAIRRLPAVASTTTVATGTLWLHRTVSAKGSILSQAPPGYAIPLDVAVIDPSAYAAVVGPSARGFPTDLRQGGVILSETSAAIRGARRGTQLELSNGVIRVAAVAPDVAVGAHEVVVSSRRGAALGITEPSYLLARLRPGRSASAAVALIRRIAGPSLRVRVRSASQTPYLRQADGVLPPEWEKVYFGEFAARPEGDGSFRLDPAWVRQHVGEARIPLLGTVRCNRALLDPLRAALGSLQESGLGSLVRRNDYGGCFVPRAVRGGSSLSHHTWGAAIDVNVSSNGLGQPPHQDPRLVRAFERAGFVWGGRFLRPDGMHFEFGCPRQFPVAETVRVPHGPMELPLCRGGER